jgi:tetratricopeptide (TPR) repeat protein
LRQSKWKDGSEAIDRAIELDPNAADAYEKRGILYARPGDFQAALADLNMAMQLDPASERAFQTRSYVHGKRGNTEEASADAAHAAQLARAAASEAKNPQGKGSSQR